MNKSNLEMSLFRDRASDRKSVFFIQKDPDRGINKAELQKQLLTIDGLITQINQGYELHARMKALSDSPAADMFLMRLEQKVKDLMKFFVQLENPKLRIQYLDAYQAIKDKLMAKSLFESLIQTTIPLPPPGVNSGSLVNRINQNVIPPETGKGFSLYESARKFFTPSDADTVQRLISFEY